MRLKNIVSAVPAQARALYRSDEDGPVITQVTWEDIQVENEGCGVEFIADEA